MKLMTGIYGTGQSDWVLGSSKGPEGSPACHHVMVMVMVVVGILGGQGLGEAAIYHPLWLCSHGLTTTVLPW